MNIALHIGKHHDMAISQETLTRYGAQPRRGCDRDWIVHGEEDPALDVTNGSMLGFPRFDRNRRVAAQAMRDSAPDRCLFGAFKCLMLLSNCLFARN